MTAHRTTIQRRRPGWATAIVLAASMLALVPASAVAGQPAGAAGAADAVTAVRAPAQRPAGVLPKVVLGSPILTGFSRPVLFVPRGAKNATGFVVEQIGRIWNVTHNAANDTWARAGIFLDIRTLVTDPNVANADEQGLLGLAFPPDYKTSGRFYVYYTAKTDGANTVAEYRRMTSTTANASSRRKVLRIKDPYANHNAGMLAFRGSYLYVADGDGGSGGDPGNRAQSLGSRLGKILRIDPRDPDGSSPKTYSIPVDNPFVGMAGVHPEIWSYGLRNPYRFSIDPPTGDLWIGDVGQCRIEEIDHAGDARGVNFGWRKLEGTTIYDTTASCQDPQPTCVTSCETLPVAEYTHADGCAVTGGHVYRGNAYPDWKGWYIYGDYCTGKMWTIPASGPPGTPIEVSPATAINISAFARDYSGEMYAVELGGSIYRLQLDGNP